MKDRPNNNRNEKENKKEKQNKKPVFNPQRRGGMSSPETFRDHEEGGAGPGSHEKPDGNTRKRRN